MVITRSKMENQMEAMEQKVVGIESMLTRILTVVEELNVERKAKKVTSSVVDDPETSPKKVTQIDSDEETETYPRSRPPKRNDGYDTMYRGR